MSSKKSNLTVRLTTAAVAIPLLLALIFMAPAWATFALVTAAGFLVTWEYCTITFADEHRAGKLLASLISVAMASVLYFVPQFFTESLVGGFLAIFLLFLFTYKDQKRVSHQIASSITGILYGGVVLTTLSLLVRDAGEAGPFWIIMVMVVVWSSDTGAYFAGRAFGKHKLYEAVSPNKTIEGAVGGVAGSIVGAFAANYIFALVGNWEPLLVWQVLLLAIPGNILSQVGDLAESLIKRAHDVKDSGTIIPGHGGMLDRIDGLLFASPWFYIIFTHVLN
ncbi:phosphatidate cytidylyltransferase [Bradymonas sediminis]|uniref:Phosphatidate cytidylyltransferase n=1 Tax=Bradymonas sediminis TaxID=1548548 RepID=A0A2Z4FNM9_9DELT|nr:phosphatidate cytidylyltransferase [Bradymonas sediminis]AWV90298.1 phosphatidate cytidylyltransferase [Bradymonas sediminis]TDP75730.1 phosphatidate cytidylyltransferase [Bradymonas sediminis]